MDRLTVIISPGRSGSSYTAYHFDRMGFFSGKTRKADPNNLMGYFENREIHKKAKDLHGADWLDPNAPVEHPKFHNFIEKTMKRQGYQGGPWFIKIGAYYWRTFESFNPVYVKVWRDPELIFQSYKRLGWLGRFGGDGAIRTIIENQHNMMRSIEGPDIWIGEK